MTTILQSMQDDVKTFAEAIARMLKVDVEIVDNTLFRVAGTGRFAGNVGQNMAEGRVYRHVIETGSPCIIDNPGFDTICTDCRHWRSCPETFEMSTPILLGREVIGVIGFVCFTEIQREHIDANSEDFFAFLSQMAGLIASKAREHDELKRSRNVSQLLERIVDKVAEGFLILDERSRILRSNSAARQILNMEEPRPGEVEAVLVRSQDRILDLHEYELFLGGEQFQLVGEEYPLHHGTYDRVFVFQDSRTLNQYALRLASVRDRIGLDALVGECGAMVDLKNLIRKLADSDSTALIQGESGTGKELVARALHEEGKRREGPLVAVNCGAIPESLLESELFGYVRGAFTGANPRGRMGSFEQADGGTLFLDEIGDMPLHLQVKLLRALEQREITRLGASTTTAVNVRVVAATNRELGPMVTQGIFREDLYYRLHVLPVTIPPLRDRREDLALLATMFIEKHAERLNKHILRIDQEFMNAVKAYSWPGNVRELQNTMEYVVNMMQSPGTLRREILPHNVLSATPALETVDLNLSSLERTAIKQALSLYGGSEAGKKGKEMAAKRLGIGVATLYRKIARYGL